MGDEGYNKGVRIRLAFSFHVANFSIGFSRFTQSIDERRGGKEASKKEDKSSNRIGQQGKTKERKPFRVHLRVKPSIKRTQSISENRLSLVPSPPSGKKRNGIERALINSLSYL